MEVEPMGSVEAPQFSSSFPSNVSTSAALHARKLQKEIQRRSIRATLWEHDSPLVIQDDRYSNPSSSSSSTPAYLLVPPSHSFRDFENYFQVTSHLVHSSRNSINSNVSKKDFFLDLNLQANESADRLSTRLSSSQIQISALPNPSETIEDIDDTLLLHLSPEERAWRRVMRELPQGHRLFVSLHTQHTEQSKRVAQSCQKELRKRVMQSLRIQKEAVTRARKVTKDMQAFWKKYERESVEFRKKAEKEAIEKRKREEELREMKRQQRKLNFLLTQTELFGHFMANKDDSKQQPDAAAGAASAPLAAPAEDDPEFKGDGLGVNDAKRAAEEAVRLQQERTRKFDTERTVMAGGGDGSTALPAAPAPAAAAVAVSQPKIFQGELKEYQKQGLSWLANLYDQGINGILADEMGLGKTVQAISFVAHLAEEKDIWGPTLIIAPVSTLHNWQAEFEKFCPALKVIPYWGTGAERTQLRKFFSNPKSLYGAGRDAASMHVLITSYNLVIDDEKYLKRIKWQYLILDEAHAIKSATSKRWNTLLSFSCRNRLLLTGTPIQNNMAELWALLHFIMPSFFDSHEEFNEWFSKDIENAAKAGGKSGSGFTEQQLNRLHVILKPFMLRRLKKDVESEMAPKVEVQVDCEMSARQRIIYKALRQKLVGSVLSDLSHLSEASLMNLMMQFRKVCNHPDLFDRKDHLSPFAFQIDMPAAYAAAPAAGTGTGASGPGAAAPASASSFVPQLSSTSLINAYITSPDMQSPITFAIPKLMYRSGMAGPTVHLAGTSSMYVGSGSIDTISSQISFDRHFDIYSIANMNSSLSAASSSSSTFSFVKFCGLSIAEASHLLQLGPLGRYLAANRLQSRLAVHFLRQFMYSSSSIKNDSDEDMEMEEDPTVVSKRFKSLMQSFSFIISELSSPVSELQLLSLPSFSSSLLTSPPLPSSPGIQVLEPLVRPRPQDKLSTLSRTMWRELSFHVPRAAAGPPRLLCSDAACEYEQRLLNHEARTKVRLFGASPSGSRYSPALSARPCGPSTLWPLQQQKQQSGLMSTQYSTFGSTWIQAPSIGRLIADSGKLFALDKLLYRLKQEGHRVLIFCQMTRMMDILEEYFCAKNHTFFRLDGQTSTEARRDMVRDFQNKNEVFIFLLSTRAGGMGITLTAADTVIFYDSDWNPTSDLQAMDRSHRIGQTKQVTVYRMVTKGTVEETIVKRAQVKSTIQNQVLEEGGEGGAAGSGSGAAAEKSTSDQLMSLLFDDTELEAKLLEQQQKKKEIRARFVKGKERKEAMEADLLAQQQQQVASSSSSSSSAQMAMPPAATAAAPKKRTRTVKPKAEGAAATGAKRAKPSVAALAQ